MQAESLYQFGYALSRGKCRLVYLDLGNSPKMSDEAVVNFCSDLNKSTDYMIALETLILRGNSNLRLAAG
jgi:hypothetical protein